MGISENSCWLHVIKQGITFALIWISRPSCCSWVYVIFSPTWFSDICVHKCQNVYYHQLRWRRNKRTVKENISLHDLFKYSLRLQFYFHCWCESRGLQTTKKDLTLYESSSHSEWRLISRTERAMNRVPWNLH